MKKNLIILLLFFSWLLSRAQDFEKDMKAIMADYAGIDSYELEVSFRIYRDHHSAAVMEEKTANVIRNGNKYYSDMFGMITLINEKYILLIDYDHDMVMIDKMSPERLKNSELFIRSDSLMEMLQKLAVVKEEKWIKKTVFEKTGPAEACYTVYFNYGDYHMQKVFFNPEDHQLKKTVYYYETELSFEEGHSSKPRLEVIYKNYKKGFSGSEDIFSEQKYLTVNRNRQITLKEKYSEFSVVNHLLKAEDYQRIYNGQNQNNYE